MPGMNGLVATRTLKQIQPDSVIVILTRHGDDAYLQELLRAGADGYVLKQSAASELLQAIRATAARGQYLDSALTARVTAGFLSKSGRKAQGTGRQPERTGVRGPATDCRGLQQQGNRGAARIERQDRRSPQGQCRPETGPEGADRHRQIRPPPGLAQRHLVFLRRPPFALVFDRFSSSVLRDVAVGGSHERPRHGRKHDRPRFKD